MSSSLTVKVRIDGVRETLRAFRELPKDANDKLREGSLELAETLAGRIRAAAYVDSPQSALMAPTVRARRDRVPVVQAGGSRRVGRNRVPAYKILFGSMFGASSDTANRGGPLAQFRPHLGQESYWFFRTVEQNESEIASKWREIADDILREWAD